MTWPPRPDPPSREELEFLAAGLRNHLEFGRASVRMFPGAQCIEMEGFYIRSHLQSAEGGNEVRVIERPRNPKRIVELAHEHFDHCSPRWRLLCPQEWEAEMGLACKMAGLTPAPAEPVMVMPSRRWRPVPSVPGVECRRVENWSDLEIFSETGDRAHDLPPNGSWLSRPLLDTPNLDLMVAYLDDEPVATGVGYTAEGIVDLGGIATLPNRRRRGVATLVAWELIRAGGLLGGHAAHLWASEMGFPVYVKMGFRHVQNMMVWTFQSPR